jgi:hypothetical protein
MPDKDVVLHPCAPFPTLGPERESGPPSSTESIAPLRILSGETLLRLHQVPDLLPRNRNGKKVGLASVYRWTDRGVRGIRLEYIRAPWGRVTSIEAVERFLQRLNGDRKTESDLTPARRRREIQRATQYVAASLGLDTVTRGGQR